MTNAAKRTILYGVLALCLMGFCWVSGRAAGVASVTFSEAHALLGGHAGYQRVIDSLKGTEAHYVGLEGFWRRKADSIATMSRATAVMRDTANSSSASAVSTSTNAENPAALDSVRVVFLGRALDFCDSARLAADSALALCRARGDSLERSLREVLAIKTCHFLFLKCPSRGALFVSGVVLGSIAAYKLSH